ncbi:MAG: hypothetical protein U1F06_03845 [Steroidobacteraceae bacterium]
MLEGEELHLFVGEGDHAAPVERTGARVLGQHRRGAGVRGGGERRGIAQAQVVALRGHRVQRVRAALPTSTARAGQGLRMPQRQEGSDAPPHPRQAPDAPAQRPAARR